MVSLKKYKECISDGTNVNLKPHWLMTMMIFSYSIFREALMYKIKSSTEPIDYGFGQCCGAEASRSYFLKIFGYLSANV
jgi:hypothetical protein